MTGLQWQVCVLLLLLQMRRPARSTMGDPHLPAAAQIDQPTFYMKHQATVPPAHLREGADPAPQFLCCSPSTTVAVQARNK